MNTVWDFLFTGFGGLFALITLAVVVGAGVLVWWSRNIDQADRAEKGADVGGPRGWMTRSPLSRSGNRVLLTHRRSGTQVFAGSFMAVVGPASRRE
jgi:hypothetical protein